MLMNWMPGRVSFVALLLSGLLLSSAQAQTPRIIVPGYEVSVCEGEISTFPLGSIPLDAYYWVDILDETKEALAFRDSFLAALEDGGLVTNRDARLVFSFESESAFLGLVPRGGIDNAQRNVGRDRDPGREVGVSELRDTIREGADVERRRRTSLGQQLDAKAELRDMETGRVVWLATLACSPRTGDRRVLSDFVSRVVIESLSRENGKIAF
ncbi:MAG: hypothetical protein JJ899_15005 [Alphaproteobacteria bacterium]|nr:hypothetical protein [Alphaproteobacteria bacterium]